MSAAAEHPLPAGGKPMEVARTWMFVPGDRPDRFDKAQASAADQIILDLEDAVDAVDKPRARREVEWWLSHGGSGWVRINGIGSEWYAEDVRKLCEVAGLRGVILPKAEVPAALQSLGRQLDRRGLIPLIESARGVHRAHEISELEEVDRLAFGSIDFAGDVNAHETRHSLLLARLTLVLASRVAEKPAPIDGVTTTFSDVAVVAEEALYSRSLGFGGKLCIHPAQLAPVSAAFDPTPEELSWARGIVRAAESSEGGAIAARGRMIDKPVLDRARGILRQATSRIAP
jgi:citrate lyase subunit beta/citryl-CoA lyase